MEHLLVKRRTLKRRLTLVKNKLDSQGNEPLDIHDVDLLSEQIAEIWSEFNQLSEDIIAACDEEDEDTHELALNEMSERCYSIKKTLRLILAELNDTDEVNTSHSEHHGGRGPASHADVPSVKLPKLDLPSFSGYLLQWTHFYDVFRSSVHNQKISGSQKLQYLKGCLGGEAEKLIQHSISDANYQEAWNVLTKRYQNIRELVKTLIEKFNFQPYLTHKSVSQLRQLVDTSTSCILALKALDRKVSVDDDNDWVTHGIMSRLDQDTRELWESKLGREAMPKLRELLEFLDDRVRILGTASNKNQLNERKTEANNKRQISAHQTNLEQNCPSCNEGHSIYSCKEFAKMNATDKKRCVEKRHLCYNCLKPGHGASDYDADNLLVAAKVAANDIYMDDLVSGEFTLSKALSLQKDAIELLKRGGFDLRKWSSSYSEIFESVSPDMREILVPLSFDESDSIKALGIRWHPTTDLFQYK
ncbi:unnamed protein product, partial [Allacma fusca]